VVSFRFVYLVCLMVKIVVLVVLTSIENMLLISKNLLHVQ
jgi:hypothetical protein